MSSSTMHWMCLGHFNPPTLDHLQIFQERLETGELYIFPVRFKKNGHEVNASYFPLTYEERESIIKSVLGDKVKIFPDYTFHAPYMNYVDEVKGELQPNKKSFELKDIVLSKVPEPRMAYTGDEGEYKLFTMLGIPTERGERKPVAATHVRELIYKEITGEKIEEDWRKTLPTSAVDILNSIHERLKGYAEKHFAGQKDPSLGDTLKIEEYGLKVPLDGLLPD